MKYSSLSTPIKRALFRPQAGPAISRPATAILVGMFLCHVSMPNLLRGQAKSDSGQGGSSELVDGLLDLLKEPQPDSPKLETDPTARPKLSPADVGLDGEDLGEQSDNPLVSVRQSMWIAAGYLERGMTHAETQTLQSDIIRRLDELIAQVEQANQQQRPEESQQASRQPQNDASQSTQEMQFSNPQPANRDKAEPGATEPSMEPSESNPGQTGARANAIVDLADPQVLQQSVWGQLPERVRKQMQSRMVERFLPSYREQIAAYFQALLKEP